MMLLSQTNAATVSIFTPIEFRRTYYGMASVSSNLFFDGRCLATPVYVIGRKLRTSPHNVGHFVVCQYYRHVNVYRCAGENNPSVMGNILSETSFSISNSLYVVVISTRLLIIFQNSAHVCIFLQVYGPYR